MAFNKYFPVNPLPKPKPKPGPIVKKRRLITVEKLRLSNPQKVAVSTLLKGQKNKYKKLLHEAHERLHIIADLTSGLEFWVNVSGTYEHISPSCEKVTGYTPDEFIRGEITLEKLIHEESLRTFLKDRRKSLLGESGEDVQYKFIKKDRSVRWALVNWNPVYTRKGTHIGIRISIADITNQKRCQELANNFEIMFKGLCSEVQELAVFSIDPSGKIKTWNRTAEKLTGYKAKDILGQDFEKLHAEEGNSEHILQDLSTLEDGVKHTYMAWLKKKSGARVMGNITLTGLQNAKGALTEIACFISEAKEKQ